MSLQRLGEPIVDEYRLILSHHEITRVTVVVEYPCGVEACHERANHILERVGKFLTPVEGNDERVGTFHDDVLIVQMYADNDRSDADSCRLLLEFGLTQHTIGRLGSLELFDGETRASRHVDVMIEHSGTKTFAQARLEDTSLFAVDAKLLTPLLDGKPL